MPRTYKPRDTAPTWVDDHIRPVDAAVFDTRFRDGELKIDEAIQTDAKQNRRAALDGVIVKRHVDLVNDAIAGSPLDELYAKLASFTDDFTGFVRWAFPWGEPGTELEHMAGAEVWQHDQQERISERIRAGGPMGCVIEEDVSSGHGVGKLLAYSMQIPTPLGTRVWGDLQPGDYVFGSDGAPTRITQTHHYRSVPMYRITFDDRSTTEVSSGHLWNVRGRSERRHKREGWRTIETIELARIGAKRANGAAMACQWEIPAQGAAQFEARATPLHPYFVGVWIGDGSKGEPTYTKPHPEVRERVEACGYTISVYGDGKTNRLRGITKLMTDPLFACGSHERYIPDDYKFNTIEARRALFDGLMDTDGEAHKSGSIGYSTTSRRLADDVIWLARSLGCKAMMQETVKKTWYPDGEGGRVECRDCYRITINAPFNPFTIKHRRDAYKPSEHRYLVRWIESIEPIPNADGMCISVEAEDHLYQANDFIVTHNSAQVAWLILWAISTHEDTRGVVTANTDLQLRTKTWAELATWYNRFIAKQLFTLTATSIYVAGDKDREKQWRIDQVPWSAEKTEAFAGLHNQGKRLLIIFDEASQIHDNVWTVTEGALTDAKTQIIWVRYGNPTRTSGKFFKNCSTSKRNGYVYARVDSRTVNFTNKEQIQAWIDEYGEDSDFVRVRVKGMFPRAGYDNFISPGLVTEARRRKLHPDVYRAHPKVLACDPARFGDDSTVITLRQGLKVHWQLELKGFDGFEVANRLANLAREEAPVSCIVYDAIGNGAELDGALRRVPGLSVSLIPVMWGQPAKDDKQYFNQRSEAWGKMRDWLEHGSVPDNDELSDQLTGLSYGYDGRFRIQLESKRDAKKRGIKSPDRGDSLALSMIPDLIDRKISNAKVRPVQRRKIVWSR